MAWQDPGLLVAQWQRLSACDASNGGFGEEQDSSSPPADCVVALWAVEVGMAGPLVDRLSGPPHLPSRTNPQILDAEQSKQMMDCLSRNSHLQWPLPFIYTLSPVTGAMRSFVAAQPWWSWLFSSRAAFRGG